MAEVHGDQRRVLRRQVAAAATAVAAFLCGCSGADCTTTDTSLPAPGAAVTAIERAISCGGAAGSLDHDVLLTSAGEDEETLVVATTGPVYDMRWRDDETLVVEVDPIDEIGDPVGEYVERVDGVRIVLIRRTEQ